VKIQIAVLIDLGIQKGKKKLFSNESFKKLYIYLIPLAVIKALALFKQACAMVSGQFGLDQHISNAIVQACTEIFTEKFNDQFPLSASQPGSGIH
jgi:fumarate hydratase class II